MWFWKKSLKKYQKKSFSQSGEDLIINKFFKVIGTKNPNYLDIGAYHPYYLNNTALFYLSGSRGVNVDADPTVFKLLNKHRKYDTNLNILISNEEKEHSFFLMDAPSLNTASLIEAKEIEKNTSYRIKEEVKLNAFSINSVLFKYFLKINPDILSIDIEGLDFPVLSNLDFDTWKPSLICIESIKFKEKGFGEKNNEISKFLHEKDYSLYGETYINSIFVRNKFLL